MVRAKGAEKRPRQTITAGQGHAIGQTHVGATQQPIEGQVGEAVGLGRGLQKGFVDAAVRVLLAQRRNHLCIPAGVYHAKASGIDKQRHVVKPLHKRAPLVRVGRVTVRPYAQNLRPTTASRT